MSSSFLAIIFTFVVLAANLFNRWSDNFGAADRRETLQTSLAETAFVATSDKVLPVASHQPPVVSNSPFPSPSALLPSTDVQPKAPLIPNITAASYLLWGERKGLMLAKNIYAPLPIASITKLMTALLFRENFRDDAILTISGDSETLGVLYPGEKVNKETALRLLLISSNNAAADSIATAIGGDFVKKMNDRARELGLTHTTFADPTGLNPNTRASSADILTLMRAIEAQAPELLAITRISIINVVSQSGRTYELKNTNELLWRTFGILGGKTGYTDAARGCLVLEFERKGERFIGVILGSEDRFQDMETLIEYASSI